VLNLPAGFSLLGNNLDRPADDLNTILGPSAGAIPAGSEVYKWQNGGIATTPWLHSVYNGTTWSSDLSFAPGEAVFLEVFSPVTLTFTGVPATLNLPVNIGVPNDGHFYAYSDQHPPGGAGNFFTITGQNPLPSQCMYLWTGVAFQEYDYDEFDLTWDYAPDPINGPPVPVGGAMFTGCGGIPPIPEPSPALFTLALAGIFAIVRRSRVAR
jgi:hypothetical protein